MRKVLFFAGLAVLLLGGCVQEPPPAAGQLQANLAGGTSATAVLAQWCGRLKLAAPPVIHALRDPVQVAADAPVRALLAVADGEPVRYRRVKLACGTHVLSEADNWYVPSRLTPEMNRMLDETDTPFGTVVKPLDFHRRILDSTPAPGSTILKVRALLLTRDEVPFSLVVENYTAELAPP